MAEVAMPQEMIDWMRQRNWGEHHLQWHVERNWGLLPADAQAQFAARGWKRYQVQEGEESNGVEFLAMHRAMIGKLISVFPQHKALFAGWSEPPTDPADAADPLPGGVTTPFPAERLATLARVRQQLTSFDGEDEFGRYLETQLRPFPNQPRRRSADPATGIHNFLHNRFSDEGSAIDMGDPAVNIENQRFWKLHGWIDVVWTNYRRAVGLSDTDSRYLQMLAVAGAHLDHVVHPDAERALAARVAWPPKLRAEVRAVLASR